MEEGQEGLCGLAEQGSEGCWPPSSMSPEVKVYIRYEVEDPVKIWTTLKNTFVKPVSAPKFQAYSIKKDASETLDALINRVDEQITIIKSLTPDAFSLDSLYDNLASMTIINSLPHDFNAVVSTLAVMDKFSKKDVVLSLRNLESATKQSSSVLVATSRSVFRANSRSRAILPLPLLQVDSSPHL